MAVIAVPFQPFPIPFRLSVGFVEMWYSSRELNVWSVERGHLGISGLSQIAMVSGYYFSVLNELSTISRSVLFCVAISDRSPTGFRTLRRIRSQPGIQPHLDTCQAPIESFPHAAVRGLRY